MFRVRVIVGVLSIAVLAGGSLLATSTASTANAEDKYKYSSVAEWADADVYQEGSIGWPWAAVVQVQHGLTTVWKPGGAPETVLATTLFVGLHGDPEGCWIIPDEALQMNDQTLDAQLHIIITNETPGCWSATLINGHGPVAPISAPAYRGTFSLPMNVDVVWASSTATMWTTIGTEVTTCGRSSQAARYHENATGRVSAMLRIGDYSAQTTYGFIDYTRLDTSQNPFVGLCY